MAKPAARQLVDMAGHKGPIMTGSPNVTIGNFPAARKGDQFLCSSHGTGAISEGSETVTINGIPAARMGDLTACNASPPPPTVGPAPPEYHFVTLAKSSNPDGTVSTVNPDVATAKVFNAYANFTDVSGDGSHDHMTAGLVLAETDIHGRTADKGEWGVGGNMGFSVAKVEVTGGMTEKDGMTSVDAKAKATGITYNGGVNFGDGENNNAALNGKVEIGTAEAKAELTSYDGGEEGKYGAYMEVGAEAAVIKAEAEFDASAPLFKFKATAGASAESVGASVGFGGYLDTKNYAINLRISGMLAAVLGLSADIDITIGDHDGSIRKWLFGEDKKAEESKDNAVSGLAGEVLSGMPTVLIGG